MPDVVLPCLGGGPDVELRAQAPGTADAGERLGVVVRAVRRGGPELVAFHERAAAGSASWAC
jgi:hypothetical protein